MIQVFKKAAFIAAFLFPVAGLAHSPIEGVDNFYNGLLHPVFVPAHLLLAIAIGLFIGQRGIQENRTPVGVCFLAVVLGLVMAWFVLGTGLEPYILISASVIGLMVAANPSFGPAWYGVFAAVAGLLLGLDSPQETLSGKEKFVTLVGSGLGISLLVVYPMAMADYFKSKAWQKIAVRIVGSWIAASSLLVLTLTVSSI